MKMLTAQKARNKLTSSCCILVFNKKVLDLSVKLNEKSFSSACAIQYRPPPPSPIDAVFMSRKVLRQSQFITHMVSFICIYMGVHFEIQTGPDRPQHDCPARLCYRPVVFFLHFRLLALSFWQGNIRRAFQKHNSFYLFFFKKKSRTFAISCLKIASAGECL